MARIAVGGTFEPLHAGHKALLTKASELSRGGELLVGSRPMRWSVISSMMWRIITSALKMFWDYQIAGNRTCYRQVG